MLIIVYVSGEVRVPGLQNGGSQCWEGGGGGPPTYQPSYPPTQPGPGQEVSVPAGQPPAAGQVNIYLETQPK